MTITSCRRVHESEWTASGVSFYRAREIVALHEKKPIEPLFISEELYEKNTQQCGKIQPDDLLVTGVGTIGIQYLVKKGDRFYFKDGNIIWLKHTDVINGLFLYYAFDGEFIRKQILHDAGVGTVGTYTIENAKNTRIILPPLPEQEKIARILSCWDTAIEQMQNLITEKKELKRGLMQQLLTGKIRLPGFEKKWVQSNVHELVSVSKGTQLNRIDMIASGYPVFNGGITESGFTNKWNTEKNTIIISEGGNSCGFVNFITANFWAGGHCYILSTKDSTNKIFLYQLLKYQETNLMKLRVGSGLPNIQQTALNKFKLFLPSDIKEQRAIADILTKADTEIELLNKKLDVLKEQKKGLMQKLLTGEIRVKVDKNA